MEKYKREKQNRHKTQENNTYSKFTVSAAQPLKNLGFSRDKQSSILLLIY